jgi:predicted transcriptional regulator
MEANAQQRAKWVERWKDSGLTAKEFAAESGVKVSALYNWSSQLSAAARRRVSGRDSTAQPVQPSPMHRLIELPVVTVDTASAMIELLVGDVRVRVPSGFDELTLTRVVRALTGAR